MIENVITLELEPSIDVRTMTDSVLQQPIYVVVKHVFEEYFAGGIDICGVYNDKNAAFDCLMTEADKTLKFINDNAEMYPSGIRLFGSEDYWTACVKEKGMTKNIAEVFIKETRRHDAIVDKIISKEKMK